MSVMEAMYEDASTKVSRLGIVLDSQHPHLHIMII